MFSKSCLLQRRQKASIWGKENLHSRTSKSTSKNRFTFLCAILVIFMHKVIFIYYIIQLAWEFRITNESNSDSLNKGIQLCFGVCGKRHKYMSLICVTGCVFNQFLHQSLTVRRSSWHWEWNKFTSKSILDQMLFHRQEHPSINAKHSDLQYS